MKRKHVARWLFVGVTSSLLAIVWMGSSRLYPNPSSVIVQGQDTKLVGELVRQVGGRVTHDFGIINAVAADLTARQIAEVLYPECTSSDIGTVHSMLKRLEQKKLVRRSRRTHPHRFSASGCRYRKQSGNRRRYDIRFRPGFSCGRPFPGRDGVRCRPAWYHWRCSGRERRMFRFEFW